MCVRVRVPVVLNRLCPRAGSARCMTRTRSHRPETPAAAAVAAIGTNRITAPADGSAVTGPDVPIGLVLDESAIVDATLVWLPDVSGCAVASPRCGRSGCEPYLRSFTRRISRDVARGVQDGTCRTARHGTQDDSDQRRATAVPAVLPAPAVVPRRGEHARERIQAVGRAGVLPSHICIGTWAHRCHICTGTGRTAATCAPGLGPTLLVPPFFNAR